MGIYSAMTTAVTGLKAQSFALENISGNIANSQTTGFKRIDTDFIDLIADAPRTQQAAGSVLAQSRATNALQGDIKAVSTDTYMAINGNGFFIVEPRISQSDGNPVFAGQNLYTRRGDFDIDKNGYLVNGSGYYLKGLAIDPATQNISGSVPQVLQLSNAFLPAAPSTRINYQLNLPQQPNTDAYKIAQGVAGSELLKASDFMTVAPDVAAGTTGSAVLTGTADAASVMPAGQSMSLTVGSSTLTFDFYDGALGAYSGSNIGIDVEAGLVDIDAALAAIQAQLRASGVAGTADATVARNGTGAVAISLGTNTSQSFAVASAPAGLGLASTSNAPVLNSQAARVATVSAANSVDFIAQSVAGGAITVYAQNGAPADVQMRWAKISSEAEGGVDRWNLFYMTNSEATGSQPMWQNVGIDYTFGADGALNPPVTATPLTGLTVNGVSIGNITLQHGPNGITQFNDPNGTAQVTTLSQNGYAAGEYVSVAINDSGRVVVTYSNGQQLEVAQVVIAEFNAANQLKRMDGGVFAATSDSGEPIFNLEGGILGASLESSNTDISEEFTKLIVTQQAYAAGTRIVSTADEMMQEALNMVR
ncbi:flagellar hook protein FlgE [Devosia enhydra]|uniref:Flagellar hook protein FlgE n=1 Tax=Devosia enhydra TaxID=665118 RepID=A0A1K2HTT6_9HYPH|nr:flagellar hook-basal body complex protein [Devosia enhydra]SFZ81476.1 flagellar hook protein FlgE [Devosia enhydra]